MSVFYPVEGLDDRLWALKSQSVIPETNKTSFVSSFQPVLATPIKSSFPESAGTLGMSDCQRLGEVLNGACLLLRVLNVRSPAVEESKFGLVIQQGRMKLVRCAE